VTGNLKNLVKFLASKRYLERGIEKGQDGRRRCVCVGVAHLEISPHRVPSGIEGDAKDTAAASPRSSGPVVWSGAGRTQPVTQAATFRACRGIPLYNPVHSTLQLLGETTRRFSFNVCVCGVSSFVLERRDYGERLLPKKQLTGNFVSTFADGVKMALELALLQFPRPRSVTCWS
jgi:hypothetical protein